MNLIALLVAALVPLLIGFIWYNPKVFGNAWMKAADMSEEKMQGANMGLIFGLSFVFSFLAASALYFASVHQAHLFSILINEPGINDPNSEISVWLTGFMDKYGNNFRTFQHGLFHGTLTGFVLALPVLGVNALFERKGFKYIAINAGFWIVCFALMGGIVCAWQ